MSNITALLYTGIEVEDPHPEIELVKASFDIRCGAVSVSTLIISLVDLDQCRLWGRGRAKLRDSDRVFALYERSCG